MLFDEISDQWKEIAEANSTEKQVQFVMKSIKKGVLVLDLCCGTGRHSVGLSKKGYEMVGLDISSNLLKIAKFETDKANVDLQLVRADMRFVPFKSDIFAAIVSLDASFGYLSSIEEDLQTLNEVWRTLKCKGIFLMDLFNRDRLALRYKKGFTINAMKNIIVPMLSVPGFVRFFGWKEYRSFFLLQRSQVTRGGNLVETWFFRDKKTKQIASYQHVIRLYSLPQLLAIFKKACLKLVKTYGNYGELEYVKNSARLIVITQKV